MFLWFVYFQERLLDYYIKIEVFWDDYLEIIVESYGIFYLSEDIGYCYGISSIVY